jgi:predicted membrane-bound mannosyltransferase
MTATPANATTLNPDEDRSRIWIISLLVALIVVRVLLQVVLYRSGFLSLSADEFGRTYFAARWIQTGETYSYGPWLPFHMYLYGAALSLWGDMLWMPRLVTIVMGVISIVFMYLFGDGS